MYLHLTVMIGLLSTVLLVHYIYYLDQLCIILPIPTLF